MEIIGFCISYLCFDQCLIPAEQPDMPLSDVKKHKDVLKKVSIDFCNEQSGQVSYILIE